MHSADRCDSPLAVTLCLKIPTLLYDGLGLSAPTAASKKYLPQVREGTSGGMDSVFFVKRQIRFFVFSISEFLKFTNSG